MLFTNIPYREAEAARQLPAGDMGQATGGGGGDPHKPRHPGEPRGAVPGRGEHVLLQDVLHAVRPAQTGLRDARQVQHLTVRRISFFSGKTIVC